MLDSILLIRHGETLHNVHGVAQGWSDSALTEEGERQVSLLARRVAAMRPTSLFCSTLQRAITTGERIAEATGLPLHQLDDLREMNCGLWEGRVFTDVRIEEADMYRRWASDPEVACPEGESFRHVFDRLRRAFGEIERLDPKSPGRPVIVSHGTAIRIGATYLLGLPLTAARGFAQDNTALNVFLWRSGRYVLTTWNDTSHCTISSEADSAFSGFEPAITRKP